METIAEESEMETIAEESETGPTEDSATTVRAPMHVIAGEWAPFLVWLVLVGSPLLWHEPGPAFPNSAPTGRGQAS